MTRHLLCQQSESGGMLPNDRFQPFSNGFEFRMWTANNCERGQGGCRSYNPNAGSSKDGCPMEVALAMASCGDGQIKAKHGLRAGILAPEGGMLVMADGDASTWRCPEYRGRDEPDDRPRRGPRQPADQMDLLDPRNVPDRERVAS
jgi:hypothetical protein